MNIKLTLTVEEKIISKAKIYAKNKGRSLSDIIENYLKILTQENSENELDKSENTPITKSLKGAFKAPSDSNYKEQLSKKLTNKYL